MHRQGRNPRDRPLCRYQCIQRECGQAPGTGYKVKRQAETCRRTSGYNALPCKPAHRKVHRYWTILIYSTPPIQTRQNINYHQASLLQPLLMKRSQTAQGQLLFLFGRPHDEPSPTKLQVYRHQNRSTIESLRSVLP